jgi:hypothetical protein
MVAQLLFISIRVKGKIRSLFKKAYHFSKNFFYPAIFKASYACLATSQLIPL